MRCIAMKALKHSKDLADALCGAREELSQLVLKSGDDATIRFFVWRGRIAALRSYQPASSLGLAHPAPVHTIGLAEPRRGGDGSASGGWMGCGR